MQRAKLRLSVKPSKALKRVDDRTPLDDVIIMGIHFFLSLKVMNFALLFFKKEGRKERNPLLVSVTSKINRN